MLTIAYCRISTLEQDTRNQLLEISEAGYRPDLVFEDKGISGATHASVRPEFAKLIETIEKASEPVRLVATKLDRLGRDTIDIMGTIDRLRTSNVELVVLQLGKLDLTSAAGRLTLNVLSAVAEMERDLIRERTMAGLAKAKAAGKKLGRPSKLNEAQVRDVLARLENGASVSAVARTFGVSRATILNVRSAMALQTS